MFTNYVIYMLYWHIKSILFPCRDSVYICDMIVVLLENDSNLFRTFYANNQCPCIALKYEETKSKIQAYCMLLALLDPYDQGIMFHTNSRLYNRWHTIKMFGEKSKVHSHAGIRTPIFESIFCFDVRPLLF